MMETIKRKNVKTLSILSLLFIISSCASVIKVRTPSTRFISPESVGTTFKGEAQAFIPLGTVAEVNLDNGTVDEPLELGKNASAQSFGSKVGLNANWGLVKDLDLLVHIPGAASPSYMGLRYQLIGKNRKEAKAGNHSIAITAMLGGGSTPQKNDDAVELTPKDEEAEVDLGFNSTDFSFIYGYRAFDKLLFYTGVSTTTTSFKGVLTSKNTLIDDKTLSNTGRADGYHLGLSYDIGTRGFIKLEHSGQKVNWQRTPVRSFNYTSLAMGFNWL